MNNQFVYRLIDFTCGCGKQGDYFTQIGISSGYELVVRWHCAYCHKVAQVVMPLEEIVQNAPTPPEPEVTVFDEKFLAAAHIRME